MAQDDRELEGHEAREEQQLRGDETGADSEPDTTPHGVQGQRGLFGKYKSKSPV